MTRHDRQQLVKGLAFISPWLVGFCGLTALPIALSLYHSLCDYSLIQRPAFVGLDNYRLLAQDTVFWQSLKNTLVYACLAIPGALLVSVGLAMLLNARIKGQAIYRTIIFLPSLVPVVAASMVWMWLFNGKLGLINYLLSYVGVEGPSWLTGYFAMSTGPNGKPDILWYWAMPALVLMSFWGVGNAVVIYLAGLQDIPTELYEAADLDGAGLYARIRHVTLPMLSPVIFFNLIMGIIGTLQVFTIPYIMTPGGGTDRSTYFFTTYLYDNAFLFLKMGYASAMAWVQLVMILLLTAVAFWSSRRWVHYQGK